MLWTECLHPSSNSYVEIPNPWCDGIWWSPQIHTLKSLTPNMMIFGGGALDSN